MHKAVGVPTRWTARVAEPPAPPKRCVDRGTPVRCADQALESVDGWRAALARANDHLARIACLSQALEAMNGEFTDARVAAAIRECDS